MEASMRRVLALALLLTACTPKATGTLTTAGGVATPATTTAPTTSGTLDLSKFPAQEGRKASYHYQDAQDTYEDVFTFNKAFPSEMQTYMARNINGKQVNTSQQVSLALYREMFWPDVIKDEGFLLDRDWAKVTSTEEEVTVKAGTFKATKLVLNSKTYWMAKPYMVKAVSTAPAYTLELTKLE
jgi:hypothetical protein